jgi:hypothetical protein
MKAKLKPKVSQIAPFPVLAHSGSSKAEMVCILSSLTCGASWHDHWKPQRSSRTAHGAEFSFSSSLARPRGIEPLFSP